MAVPAYDWIGFHADIRPDSVALIDDYSGKTHTYAELDDRVRRMAAWLAGKGVGEGDRVAFLSENTIDIFEVLFACAHLKAIIVPLNWRLAAPELQFIVGDSRPTVLIYEEQFRQAVDQLVAPSCLSLGDAYEAALAGADPDAAPPVTATHDDPLAIMYTSGTTGHPKGALITHRMFFYNAINIGDAVGLTYKSRNLNVLLSRLIDSTTAVTTIDSAAATPGILPSAVLAISDWAITSGSRPSPATTSIETDSV